MLNKNWLVLVSLWLGRFVHHPTPQLKVSNGWIQGAVSLNGAYLQYLSIPYATVERRFQAPGPEPTWSGVFNAVDENIKCPQKISDNIKILIGQEDCLTLNVYVPNKGQETPLPVMVFIHGGGFYAGSSSPSFYGPDYLVQHGVVLVTINYRLNIQGFVCLHLKDAPGNAGMKDQVAALMWIKRNIKAFGGDPDNVTIFGESAGAASVSYHVLSPMSKGLFHKAISQSGSSLGSWAYQMKPIIRASLLAKEMGHITQDPKELYDIFMNKTDKELIVTRVPRRKGNNIISELLYVPCVEKEIEGERAFLLKDPFEILTEGNFNKVPMIIGTNSLEGLLFAERENASTLSKFQFEKALPSNLKLTNDQRKTIASELELMYMAKDNISEDTLLKLSRLHGEPYFIYPSIAEAEVIAKKSDKPLYSYVFNFDGYNNIAQHTVRKSLKIAKGATHADELFYLFKQSPVPKIEEEMIEKMSTMWTNFAKYGDPTPELTELLPVRWPPLNTSGPKSLFIDEEFAIVPLWYSDSLKYWHKIYTKYRKKA